MQMRWGRYAPFTLRGAQGRVSCAGLAVIGVLAAGCSQAPEGGSPSQQRQAVAAPLAAAYCQMVVEGVGAISTEDEYLPGVVMCENGGANLEALKAQAIAARSVAYYNMATQGSICDSQGCQVYSCSASPSAKVMQAVQETSGLYLAYDQTLTYGFYVDGDHDTAPPTCIGAPSAPRENYVTYNEGQTGAGVSMSTLGYIPPNQDVFGQNRGCMSQWGARCLDNELGYGYEAILRFYYGADIEILQAPGDCVTPVEPPPTGGVGGAGTAGAMGAGGSDAASGAGGAGTPVGGASFGGAGGTWPGSVGGAGAQGGTGAQGGAVPSNGGAAGTSETTGVGPETRVLGGDDGGCQLHNQSNETPAPSWLVALGLIGFWRRQGASRRSRGKRVEMANG